MTNHNEQLEQLINIPLVNKAFTFAYAAHSAIGQTRKYSGEPYIVHPVEVCALVSEVEHTPEMLAAALLHDVVEDTEVTIDIINSMFGNVVGHLVDGLTDVSKPGDGNRAHRKAMDREHTLTQGKQTQTIKAADLIANCRDIIKQDPHFAVVFMKEKRLLLEGMNADKKLMDIAWKLVHDFEENLKNDKNN